MGPLKFTTATDDSCNKKNLCYVQHYGNQPVASKGVTFLGVPQLRRQCLHILTSQAIS